MFNVHVPRQLARARSRVNWAARIGLCAVLAGRGPTGSLVGAAGDDQRLINAVRAQDRAAAGQLLGKVDANARQGDGATALHWAVHWNDVELSRLLIRAGALVNAANDNRVTPLLLACTNTNAGMVEMLLNEGADPNAAMLTGETPLMAASRTGNLDAVDLLLARGARVNDRESAQHQTALMWAIAERHSDVANKLIERGAEVEARTRSGGADTTRRMRAAPSATGGFTPLLFAARVGEVESARALLTAGVSVDGAAADGSTPLLVATIRGNLNMARLLLEHGADPNATGPGYTPLHWAAGTWEATLTGAGGAAVDRDDDWRVLAGLRGQTKLDLISLLLDYGADPNARLAREPPRFGYSQFNFIWKSGNPLAPNMGPLDLSGATPFLLGAMSADVPAMRLLVQAGADPSLTTKDRTTALMLAAGIGRVQEESFVSEAAALEAVKLALELGNEVHAPNVRGQTPLHAAAFLRYNQVVQYLVDHGAPVKAKNARGQTPAVVAELTYGGSSEVVNPSATGDLLRKLSGE